MERFIVQEGGLYMLYIKKNVKWETPAQLLNCWGIWDHLTFSLSVANWRSFNSFKHNKRIKKGIKKNCDGKKINTIDGALARVWFGPVKATLESSGEKQMISDRRPGWFLLRSPDQIGSLSPAPTPENFPGEKAIDWQVHISWFFNFKLSWHLG